MKVYSMDLRERVLADSDEGMSTLGRRRPAVSASRGFGGSSKGDGMTGQSVRETIAPDPSRVGKPMPTVCVKPSLMILTLPWPRLKARLALSVALSTLWRAVAALGTAVKKNGSRGGAGISPRRERENGRNGRPRSQLLTQLGWCSSTRHGRART